MVPRWLLAAYVLALPMLGVAFGVVMAGSALARGLGDAGGARGLFWAAMVLLMLLLADVLLLVATLGFQALENSRAPGKEQSDAEE